jgi:hypothetical protein
MRSRYQFGEPNRRGAEWAWPIRTFFVAAISIITIAIRSPIAIFP